MNQEAAGRTRGVFRRKGVWWIRWACSYGHLHREKIGPKSIANQEYAKRKTQAKTEGFCLDNMKRERVILFREIVADYIKHLEAHNQWARTDSQRIHFWLDRWSDKPVRDITRQDVEQGKLSLIGARKADKSPRYRPATVNRYMGALRCCLNVAIRNGKATTNPVVGTRSLKEHNTRLKYLTQRGEAALLDAIQKEDRCQMVEVAHHTGFRWSEQMRLRERDCDFLTDILTISRSKDGEVRHVPMNSRVREILLDLVTRRLPQGNEYVFARMQGRAPALKANRWFYRAVAKARHTLSEQGHHAEAEMLEGFTWHCLRHTFASRLAMAGVDILTIKDLGGWKTLSMVARYAHLSPGRLRQGVERLVTAHVVEGENARATGTATSTGLVAKLARVS